MRAENRSVLIVDDDVRFATTLARALERRGFRPTITHEVAAATAAALAGAPDAVIVDLRLGSEDGLTLLPPLRAALPQARIIVLTGYASIATAVRAIKLGADDYLAKPVTASGVISALQRTGRGDDSGPDTLPAPMSPRRLEWEHIQRVLTDHDGNISATARTLNMHRRTLQRKLAKRPTRT